MLKKYFAALGLSICLGVANLAFANHDDKDHYEAMCQSTGIFTEAKLPIDELDKNGEARLVQLYGQCGDEPNVLIVDHITNSYVSSSPRVKHDIKVWESPKKKKPYWNYVYHRIYIADKDNKVIKTTLGKLEAIGFIDVEIPDIFSLTIKRYTSAKVGSPIFPDARGDILCKRGAEDMGLLEQGYMDYLNAKKKK